MSIKLHDYENALKYGAVITGSDIDTGTITNSNIADGTVKGAKTSLTKYYAQIAVPVLSTAGNVFGQATAPVTGTITGFFTSAGSATAGVATLFGTTAGTIAAISYGTTIGLVTGTTVLNAAVASGDTVTITGSTSGSATAYVTFVTAS